MNFNIFKKPEMNEVEQEEYDKKKKVFTLVAYLVVFVVIFAYVRLLPSTPDTNVNNNNDKPNNSETSEIDALFDQIKNNYKEKITIKVDLEDYIIEREIDEEKEIGVIVNGENKTNYINDGKSYYLINESKIKKEENLNLFNGYDTTFIKIDNIKKLISTAKDTANLEEETYKIKRYKTTLSELLTVYNQINNTLLGTNQNKEVVVNIAYNSAIEHIEVDLTDLYLTLNKDIKEVLYKVEYSQINKIDLKDLENITNQINEN